MEEIGERIRTQDERLTRDAIFLVQEKVRVYGIDTAFDPLIAWLYEDECVEVPEPRAGVLERKYARTGKVSEGYRRVGYQEEWRYVMCFFTEAAADRFIAENNHRHTGPLQTYVDSAYRNHEWIAIRKHLTDLSASAVKPAESGS